jgi:hypothetical protein
VSGANVKVNNIEYFTNQSGWASFETTYGDIGKVFYGVDDVEYKDITDYAKSVIDPVIIWDRVAITDSVVIDDNVQIGSWHTIRLKAEYEFDSVIFNDIKGTIFLNGKSMIWSNQNSMWECNVTSTTLGPQRYEVTAVEDKSFGLTAVRSQEENMKIIWNKLEIIETKFETNLLGVTSINIYPVYNYTRNPVVNAEVIVNGKVCSQLEEGTYRCEITDWSPFQSFRVEVNYPGFERVNKTASSIQVSNTILCLGFGLAILVSAIFVLRKGRDDQKVDIAS